MLWLNHLELNWYWIKSNDETSSSESSSQQNQTEPDWTLSFRNGSSEVVSLLIGSQCEQEASFWISSQRFQLQSDPTCWSTVCPGPVRSGPIRPPVVLYTVAGSLSHSVVEFVFRSNMFTSAVFLLHCTVFEFFWTSLMFDALMKLLIPDTSTPDPARIQCDSIRISRQNNPDLWFVLTFCISIAELLINRVFPSGSAQSPVLVSNSELFYWCIFYFEGFIRLPAGSVWSQNQSDRRSGASVFSAVCYFCPTFSLDPRLILAPDPTEPDCLHCIISACMCFLMLNDAEWPDDRLSVHWETQCAAEQSAGQ